MCVDLITVTKIGVALSSLAKESPLNKAAKNEYDMAVFVLANIKEETNIREGINRALVHLESAFINYSPSLWSVTESQITFMNSVCLLIALLHYLLGNNSIASQWLRDGIDTDGEVTFPQGALDGLCISEDDFYKKIGCYQKMCEIKELIANRIKVNSDHNDFLNSYNDPWDYVC